MMLECLYMQVQQQIKFIIGWCTICCHGLASFEVIKNHCSFSMVEMNV